MGRIEDALRKLEAQARQGSSREPVRREPDPVAQAVLAPFTLETQHRLPLDAVALRRWGPVAMLSDDARAKREYGQIKRPIINLALGKAASTVAAGNVVVVTSALAGDGKSLTSFNLALSIAREKDLSVLLVDADMVKPDLSRSLGLADERGLAELIADHTVQLSDVLWRTSVDGLYVVPAGRERSGVAELFGSVRMKHIIDSFAQYLPRTVVLFDSSPLLLTNESQVLVSLAGQSILVVRANQTPRPIVAEALARLDSTKPVGLVLNSASTEVAGYYVGGVYGAESQAHELAEQPAGAGSSATSPAR
jgi:exopolysaccharide/PEP-CTERM locus tyrosine autokinase